MKKFIGGWLKDIADSRDYDATRLIVRPLALPTSYTVNPNTPIYNQGQYPACVGFASAGIKSDEEYRQFGRQYRFDGLALYNRCKQLDGIPGEAGSYPRVACDILKKEGCKRENSWFTKYNWDTKWRIAAYYRIPTDATIAVVKQIIFQYGSIEVGSDWYSSWVKARKILPTPDYSIGGHAWRIDGWNDMNSAFSMVNSHGIWWGNWGKSLLSYDVFMRYILPVGDLWKLIDAIL